MHSIIFCNARVPCWLRATFARSGAALLTRVVRCSSSVYSSSFWQR